MTNSTNENRPTIVASLEELLVMQSAMSKMDLALKNQNTVALANRLNSMYSMIVASLSAFGSINRMSNIDAVNKIKELSNNMQMALYGFLTSPDFVKNVVSGDYKKEPEIEADSSGKVQEESDTLSSNKSEELQSEISNVVSFDKFKK